MIITILILSLIFFLGINFYINYIYKNSLKNSISGLDQQISLYSPRESEYRKLKNQVSELEKINNPDVKDYNYSQSLFELSNLIPDKLTLKSIRSQKGVITLNGYAANNNVVVTFVNKIKKSLHFTESDLKKTVRDEEVNFELETRLVVKGE